MSKDWLSKRQVVQMLRCNSRLFDQWLVGGLLETHPDSTEKRVKIVPQSLSNLVEGEHYIVCRQCGAYVASLSARHLKSCGPVHDAESYRAAFPDAPTASSWSTENKAKTEEQKRRQSETLKARFQTPEGELTRHQISEAAKRLMQTDYRERAAEHLRQLNQSDEMRAFHAQRTKERWDDGSLREAVHQWHEDNPELSLEYAAQARAHIKHTSATHLAFQEALYRQSSVEWASEHQEGYYQIDEALPDRKIAVEVQGCYWHSCPVCAIDGPPQNRTRDKRKRSFLEGRGWQVFCVWEHEINQDVDAAAQRVLQEIDP